MTQRSIGIVPAAATIAGVLIIGATAAQAAGFAIREQSSAAQGTSFAGVSAGGDNVSSIFYNPATLTLYDGINMSGQFSWIIPDVEFGESSASTITGAPITGGNSGNIGPQALVPAFYASWQVSPDWFLGLAVTAPFGLVTSADSGWIGRYHGLGSRLRTYNVEPMVAWKANEWLSIGGGVQVQYSDARLTSAIDLGTIGTSQGLPGGNPGDPSQDGFAAVEGDDWSYGYSLGVLLTPRPDTRIGIGYRSSMDVDLEGDAEFALSTYGELLSLLSGALTPTGGSASITLPEMVTLGVKHDITPTWTLGAEVAWTRWSRFDELVVEFDNPAQPDELTRENWEDSYFLALGATYKAREDLRLRAGVAFDEGVVPSSDFRTPRIPDADRYWFSVGAGYDLTESMTIDTAYTHIYSPKANVRLDATDPGHEGRGDLNGTFTSSADILTASLSMKF
ncbi:membrane protein involved in aromatic hydrocarbon degradation [Parvibaculum lavamentivorans DS-1]|uniref:Membrane protein involved in aromatic hydrocarbon degradation n=1 Tax=Parvibaculum lavamentivorans (strain DS-1 / DSM 13023 / NCIMB 13966) TaxID=402881 RepID=A7HXR6_PARL1|nr:outer membrane protein transport protein [Parvibaculum lavamentivorans]ABS64699.1 membrane protein involved in aromatic hydrocarbon degradation [Parvibaculum lavamentivorans DS-1]